MLRDFLVSRRMLMGCLLLCLTLGWTASAWADTAAATVVAPVAIDSDTSKINNGDTAWMLTSAALVLMMTGPGLALFYSGLVRRKNVLATMVWGKGGLFNWAMPGTMKIPALDFAGGTVVHISSGVSALVCALVLGKRRGYGKVPMAPHSVVISVIGAALL